MSNVTADGRCVCLWSSKALTSIALVVGFVAAPASGTVISPDQFGMHFQGLVAGNVWPSVPFGALRLWDTGTTWTQMEAAKGDWKFDRLDAYVSAAQTRGIKLLLTLGQTPAWAAQDPEAYSPYAKGASSPPRDLEDWRRYVRTLAERYRGRIQAWELWNEINQKQFYSGDMRTLAEMERIAAEVLRSVDPANILLTPSVEGGAFKWLDAYFAAGGGRHADVVSYHFYVPAGNPEEIPVQFARARETMARYGLDGLPIWNTEIGWLIANNDGSFDGRERPGWSTWRRLKGDEAADIVARTYLIVFGLGIERTFWFGWDHGAMGLAEGRGRTPKTAAGGYAAAYRWLIGTDFQGCSRSGHVRYCKTVQNRRTSYIVWAQTPAAFVLPKDWHVSTAERIDKGQVAIGGPSILVGPSPLRLSQ